MKPNVNRFEFWLRWGFALGLVAFLAVSFFDSPMRKVANGILGIPQTPRARCGTTLSKDFDHKEPIGIPAIEAQASISSNFRRTYRLALQACRTDTSLAAVYMRTNCDARAGQYSRTVFCK